MVAHPLVAALALAKAPKEPFAHVADVLLPPMVFGVASFTIAMFIGPYVIRWLVKLRAQAVIRREGPQSHMSKAGTPVMGGLIFSGTAFFLTATYNLIGHYSQLLTLGALASTTVLGMVDDLLGTFRIGRAGMRARFKFGWTLVIAIIIVAVLHVPKLLSHPNDVWVPSYRYVDFGWFYWPLAVLAIVACAHATNLTDGLDGLAGGTGAVGFATFGAIALLSGLQYLGSFCFTMVGALLAFLWFNIYPARVFMGDTGSLALGATLATVALLLNQLLILPVIGFVYVIITVSVMLQVSYFKLTDGRRLLRMAPLQHHLELIGWHENQITQRFWIVSMMAGVAGLVLAFS
ncbi:MAG TPA: phospho-N-acetylmuramoyl-pentapeptide-transferase [Chloroflexi bacterium]|nr:phospho-N-acetylmuramoyl-pentapeptide-transferase [Chloroflexota bacterium]